MTLASTRRVTLERTGFGQVAFSADAPFVLISGPCQLETLEHAVEIGGRLKELASRLGHGYIFKASFDKANRSSVSGKRGPGLEAGLAMLAEVKRQIGAPVLTDVHAPDQAWAAAQAGVDMLQIPAFLCRQTDLLLAAGETGLPINIKKGQFLAPWDMTHVAAKVASTGNRSITLCERGASFGYNTLVTDFRSLPIMAATGWPVVFDATHSVQQPGGLGGASGGQREFAPVLARAACALGVSGVFIESHQDPDSAPSDGPNMIPLAEMPRVLEDLSAFDALAKQRPLPR